MEITSAEPASRQLLDLEVLMATVSYRLQHPPQLRVWSHFTTLTYWLSNFRLVLISEFQPLVNLLLLLLLLLLKAKNRCPNPLNDT